MFRRAQSSEPPTLVRSLTVRLVVASLIALVLQVAILVWDYGLDDETIASYVRRQVLSEVVDALHRNGSGPWELRLSDDLARRFENDAYGLRITMPNGDTLAEQNPGLLDLIRLDVDSPNAASRVQTSAGMINIGVHEVATDQGPIRVLVAMGDTPLDMISALMFKEAFLHIALPTTPLLVLMFAVGMRTVRRGLRPLSVAADAAATIDPSRPGQRLPTEHQPREVAHLVGAVNKAFDRVDEAFETQLAFTAAAAHELRTPLAVLTLELDQLDSPSAPRLRQDVAKMARIVNQLLASARLDGEAIDPPRRVDLAAIAREVVTRIAPLAMTQNRELEFVDRDPVAVIGRSDMIADALRNLIENALRAAPTGTPIRITAGPGPVLTVDDAGPGVAPGLREVVFEPFRSFAINGKASDGAGLGLAIVRKVAQLHRGTIQIVPSILGGACFSLTLGTLAPAAARRSRSYDAPVREHAPRSRPILSGPGMRSPRPAGSA